jgi:hypothetical protein
MEISEAILKEKSNPERHVKKVELIHHTSIAAYTGADR